MSQTANQTSANTSPSGAAEATSPVSSELDALLKEFESGAQKTDVAAVLRAIAPVVEHVQEERVEKATAGIQKDIESAIAFMREPAEVKDVPTRLIRGYLDGYANENPTVKQAFDTRTANPEAWKKALGEIREAYLNDLKALPGSKVRTDVEAAVASARNQTTAPTANGNDPSPIDMMNMSDATWRQFLDQKRWAAGGA